MFESIVLQDEAATLKFGAELSGSIVPGQIVFLEGDLGSGKTTCVRGFLRGLGFTGNVKSPTYTLVEEYDFDWGKVYHFDLYRITHPDELEFMGIREYFTKDAIILIEWADHGKGILPNPSLELIFKVNDNSRIVTMSQFGSL
jgi:tRNA threonylcarbamoyladenosine biosynthesis protein TsaE